MSNEDLKARHELLGKQLDEAKRATDRLFGGELSKEESDKAINTVGNFLLNAVDLREKSTQAKVVNAKAFAKAKRLSEILKEKFPTADVEFGTDETLDWIYVSCTDEKGVVLSNGIWKDIYPLIDECETISSVIDDFEPTRAGFSFLYTPLYYRISKTE